jgi:hypothetical protein
MCIDIGEIAIRRLARTSTAGSSGAVFQLNSFAPTPPS